MHFEKIATGFRFSIKELLRSRFTVLLILIMPITFYLLAYFTAPTTPVYFTLAFFSEEDTIAAKTQHELVVFMALAASGLLSAFTALSLIQKNRESVRRLILCGTTPAEALISKLSAMLAVMICLSFYTAALLLPFFPPAHFPELIVSLFTEGFVYGCIGLLIGSLMKEELEGILIIVLLTNIDVAWLQNPVYYADAQNTAIIKSLPAYFPTQSAMVSAFTDLSPAVSIGWGLLYGLAILVLALTVYALRMKLQFRPSKKGMNR